MRNLIAILRGVTEEEIVPIVETLLAAGISKIEVPLNSPDPFSTIATMIKTFAKQGQFGAGTVLKVEEVKRLNDLGADMIVSPNCDLDVIAATKKLGMQSYPGVMTPSECFAALRVGADGLKFFPGELIGPVGLKAMRAVLPPATLCFAVGGARAENFVDWVHAGAQGFGIGSALYKAGMSAEEVRKNADVIVRAYDEAMA